MRASFGCAAVWTMAWAACGCDSVLDIHDPIGHLSGSSVDPGGEAGAASDATADEAQAREGGNLLNDDFVDAGGEAGAISDASVDEALAPDGGGPADGGDPTLWSAVPVGASELFFADATGDGYADLIGIEDSSVVVWPSNGSSFVSGGGAWLDAGLAAPGVTIEFADVTGDGKADAIQVTAAGVVVFPSLGTQFGPGSTWAPKSAEGAYPAAEASPTQFADVDGDGRADLLSIDADGVWVSLSGDHQFVDAGNWTRNAWYGVHGTAFADLDGDGKADTAVCDMDAVHALPSTGQQFDWGQADGGAGQGNYLNPWTPLPFWGTQATFFADANGDGRADAIAIQPDGVFVLLSTSHNFMWSADPSDVFPTPWSTGSFASPQVAVADVNHDHRVDLIVVDSDAVHVRLSNGSAFAEK